MAEEGSGGAPSFFYNICNDPQYGFKEYHATTIDNPTLPKRYVSESHADWELRRASLLEGLKADNDPLVYAQEYLAEFVDWAGAAFFAREKLLVDGRPINQPKVCDGVFAVIDTASKTGTDNDATAVTFFARNAAEQHALMILDWDIAQIEGATLEAWLPGVFRRLDELAEECHSRHGALGVWIEDKNSGTILLQQARRRGWKALPIESKLTAMGKDERAISVSGYVHRGQIKYTVQAYNKTTTHKRRSLNHLVNQVENFKVGDKDSRREDDLLDTFCYGSRLTEGVLTPRNSLRAIP